jgi:hypothetical protein
MSNDSSSTHFFFFFSDPPYSICFFYDLYRLYCSGGDEYEHVATSLGIADAISQCDLPSYDLSLWKEIFLRTFNRTIAQEFAEAGRTVWNVDGRWIRSRDIHPRDQRFVFVEQGQHRLL